MRRIWWPQIKAKIEQVRHGKQVRRPVGREWLAADVGAGLPGQRVAAAQTVGAGVKD